MQSGHNPFYRRSPEMQPPSSDKAQTVTSLPFQAHPLCHTDRVTYGCSVKHHSQTCRVKSGCYQAPPLRVHSWAAHGAVPARRDTRPVSQGDGCHVGTDLHGQPTELSKCHLSGGSPSSDALTPPVSLHLMASVGIFYVPKH